MNPIAWWPHTTNRQVASARLRCFRIVEELQRQGFDAGVYRPGQPAPATLVLSKRYDAGSVAHALSLRQRFGTRLVLDLCDNHFYSSGSDPKWQQRATTLRQAVAAVDLVIASTWTLRDYISIACPGHPAIAVIGDAVDEPVAVSGVPWRVGAWRAEYRLARLGRRLAHAGVDDGRRLLWFGNHGSGHAEGGMADLLLIRERLERAHGHRPLALTIISNNESKYRQVTRGWRLPTRYLDWHPRTFSRAATWHDIALIPVGQNPFTLSKTNNRVATAFMHGLAVAADAIPSYEDFADCALLNAWDEGLEQLMNDRTGRKDRITRGRARVEQCWNLPGIARQWAGTLDMR